MEWKQVKTDSRVVGPGDLFVAIEGARVDGHCFLEEAAQAGATTALISETYVGPSFGLELIGSKDVVVTLQNWAAKRIRDWNPFIVGITGSVGKTTTKEFLHHLLNGRAAKSPGNANSQLGLPLSILNMNERPEILIQEMAMSKAGQIERLTQIAPPNLAILTHIGYSHIEFFENQEALARAKCEIFSQPETKALIVGEGVSKFLPADTPERLEILNTSNMVLPFDAKHLRESFALAATAAQYLGVGIDEIEERAKTVSLMSGRFSRREINGITYVEDAYNADPVAVLAALRNLPNTKGRKIFVFGSMKELGHFSEKAHAMVAKEALSTVDMLFCLGAECDPMVSKFSEAGKRAQRYDSLDAIKCALSAEVKSGDVVLIKGANSHGLHAILAK